MQRCGRLVTVAGVAVVMTMVGGAMHAGPSTSASSTIDPVGPAGGFLVVIEGDTTLASHESEGPIAIGGDLTVAGQYQVIAASSYTYPGDPAPTSLLVGGALRLEAGQLHVNQGTAHIGDLGALEIVDNGNITHVVPPGGDQGTTPQMKVQGLADNSVYNTQVETPGLWEQRFGGAFAAFRQHSASLAALSPASCAAVHSVELRDQNNQGPYPGSGNAAITIAPGKVNVLNLTVAQLNAIPGINANGSLNASTPFIVNITDAGSIMASPANWGFIQGNTTSRYVLWNFPNATQVTLPNDGKTHWGTLYAPNAHVVDDSSGNIEGSLIAASFHHGVGANGGELHFAPFSGIIDCSPVPTTTEPVPTTTEPVPTTTEPVPTTTEPVPTTTEPVPTTTEPVPTTTEVDTLPPGTSQPVTSQPSAPQSSAQQPNTPQPSAQSPAAQVPSVQLPATGRGVDGPVTAGLVLLALGGLAFGIGRRRPAVDRPVRSFS